MPLPYFLQYLVFAPLTNFVTVLLRLHSVQGSMKNWERVWKAVGAEPGHQTGFCRKLLKTLLANTSIMIYGIPKEIRNKRLQNKNLEKFRHTELFGQY
jgi:hypothetical protein